MTKIRKITLIDDDATCNFLNEIILRSTLSNAEIEIFDKPFNAIQSLRHVAETNPDLFPQIIFLDLTMPVMDGWECLNEFSNFPMVFNECKIIILSSSINPFDMDKARQYREVLCFMDKPLSVEKISHCFNGLKV